MSENMSPEQRRVHVILSSLLMVAVSAFFLFLIATAVFQWMTGQITAGRALFLVALNVTLGCFLGVRPLWSLLISPQ